MSRLSEWIRNLFGRHKDESVMEIAQRLLGDAFDEVFEFAQRVVASLEAADENMDGVLDKREIARVLIKSLCKQLGFNIPSWVINGMIEYLVQRLRIPDFEIPISS